MSVSTQTEHDGAAVGTSAEPHSKPHPRDRDYAVVAVILAVLTAIEIAFYFLEDDLGSGMVIGGLISLMVVKFFIVAAWFMHLRFDNPLFTRAFVFGLVLAVVVYIVMLTSMEFWA